MKKSFLLSLSIIALISCQSLRYHEYGVEYTIGFSPANHIRKLIDEGNLEDAIFVYQRTASFFEDYPEHCDVVIELKDELQFQIQHKLEKSNTLLWQFKWPTSSKNWGICKTTLKNIDQSISKMHRYNRILDNRKLTQVIDEAENERNIILFRIYESVSDELSKYELVSGENFFSEYPVDLDKQKVIDNNYAMIGEKIRALPKESIASLYEKYCQNISHEHLSSMAAVYFTKELFEEKKNHQTRLSDIFASYKKTEEVGFELQEIPSFNIWVVFEKPGSDVEVDFDLEMVTEKPYSEVLIYEYGIPFEMPMNWDVVVGLHVLEVNIEQKGIESEKKQSEYEAGTITVENPDYLEAFANYQNIYADLRRLKLEASINYSTTTDPWARLGSSIGYAIGEKRLLSRLEEAKRRLDNTSRFIEKPIYKGYEYEITTILTRKITRVLCTVVYSSDELYTQNPIVLTEEKLSRLPYGLHPKDRFRFRIVVSDRIAPRILPLFAQLCCNFDILNVV